MWSRGTSFYSKFSVRELVQRNKSATAFTCDNSTGGGGGGIASYAGGSSGTSFSSHRSESVGCRLTNESFDEGALFSALKADVERTLQDTGAHITDRGSSGPANFFLNYVVKNIQGHIELKGTRIGNGYYDVNALLEEKSN